MRRRLGGDRRGQAISLNYALGLGIALILVTGLLIAGASFVNDQRTSAARTELRVIGQQLSADLASADRLAQSTSSNRTVTIERSLPPDVAGAGYTIDVVAAPDSYLRLQSHDPDVTVRVDLVNETHVEGTSVNGGRIRINYTAAGTLAVSGGGADS
ncbi:MAG: hypothetical protein ABEJ31_00475 [Haloarculaceae archaeon]